MGLDIGSTSLTAILIDVNNKSLLGARSCPNKFEITNISDRKKGRSEWDLQNMVKEVLLVASDLIKETGAIPEGIGITGQQQGVQLIDKSEQLQGPFISWQDQRLKEEIDGILAKLESQNADLSNSLKEYQRLIQLNKHIESLFKKKFREISEKKELKKND